MLLALFSFFGAVSETIGADITWSANTTDFPDGDFS